MHLDLIEQILVVRPAVLIDDGILDSFDILQIISALNEEYDISIPASEIMPQNFNSAEALYKMVQRLQED